MEENNARVGSWNQREIFAPKESSHEISRRADELAAEISSVLSLLVDIESNLNVIKSQSSALSPAASASADLAMEKCMLSVEKLSRASAAWRSGQARRPVFMDAHMLAEVVVNSLNQKSAEKGVALANSVPLHTRIHADPRTIQMVVAGLAECALQVCARGEKVEIFAPSAKGKAVAARGWTDLEIKEGDFTARIAELGKLLNGAGNISFRLDDGGAVFCVELPEKRPLAILAEDDENLLFLLRTYLELIGADVVEAPNGRVALDAAMNRAPDIILTDYQMPEMDGLELLARLRENPGTKETPVIMVTSVTERKLRERIFAMGADDLLQKPLTERELIPRVRRFIA